LENKKLSKVEFNPYEVERSFCQGCRKEVKESDLRTISVDYYQDSIKYEKDVRDTLQLFIKKTFGNEELYLNLKRYNQIDGKTNRLKSFLSFPRKYLEYSMRINPELWLYGIEKELNHEQIYINRILRDCQASCMNNAKCYCLKCRKGYCGIHWDKKLKICKPCRNKRKKNKLNL